MSLHLRMRLCWSDEKVMSCPDTLGTLFIVQVYIMVFLSHARCNFDIPPSKCLLLASCGDSSPFKIVVAVTIFILAYFAWRSCSRRLACPHSHRDGWSNHVAEIGDSDVLHPMAKRRWTTDDSLVGVYPCRSSGFVRSWAVANLVSMKCGEGYAFPLRPTTSPLPAEGFSRRWRCIKYGY